MLKYTAKRLALIIPIAFLVSILVFLVIKMIPGDPIRIMFGKNATAEQVEYVRTLWGLDKPLLELPLSFNRVVPRGKIASSRMIGAGLFFCRPNKQKGKRT